MGDEILNVQKFAPDRVSGPESQHTVQQYVITVTIDWHAT
jgi:hypothetical protein